MERLTGTVATIRKHRRHLLWAVSGGALAAILLWSITPGTIARAMPDSWHLPERMAARTLDVDRWTAGERLLATAEPERWRTAALANRTLQDNLQVISDCRSAAQKSQKAARCTVTIPAE